jgi:hypothetical protein
LAGLNGQWQTFLSPNLEAKPDGFFYILDRLFFGLSLTYATGNRRTFNDPDSVLVAIEGN